MKECK